MPKPDKPEKPTKKEKQDHTVKQVQHFTAMIARNQQEMDDMVFNGFVDGDPSMAPELQARWDELVEEQIAWQRQIDRLLDPDKPGGKPEEPAPV